MIKVRVKQNPIRIWMSALLVVAIFSILVTSSALSTCSGTQAFVTRFYEQCLERSPDSPGLNSWVDSLTDGSKSGADVAYGFILSQEFINRNTTNEAYLTILYRAFFDREPDSAGYTPWLATLYGAPTGDPGTRVSVLNGFIYSAEFEALCQTYGIQAHTGAVSTQSGSGSSSCGCDSGFFTVPPVDLEHISHIVPLGNISPPAHTFPTVHTYIKIADGSTQVPVYAPGDVTITSVSLSRNLSTGTTDYSINFSVCSQVTGYYIHISSLTADMINMIGGFTDCRTYSDGLNLYEMCDKQVSIAVGAGTVLGYMSGGSNYSSLDLGLRDTRISPINIASDMSQVSTSSPYTVCPYDYYQTGALKDALYEKLRAASNIDPTCGTIDVNTPNTAQGRWFVEGSTDYMDETQNIALVPSNMNRDYGALSIGNPNLGTQLYHFIFESSGQTNRRFDEITSDGQTYCYDRLKYYTYAESDEIQGYLFLKLENDSTLLIERVDSNTSCPDPDSLNFSGAAVRFER